MRTLKNTKSYKEIKIKLNSLYLEYKKLNNTKEDHLRLDHLITIISKLEYKPIGHLKSRNNINEKTPIC